MPSRTHTFGSDEGFEAVHEAMLKYITGPRSTHPAFPAPRGAFHTSFNLNDATNLLNLLEFIMMYGHTVQANAMEDEADRQQLQGTLEWAEQYYRDLAGTVGVELV